MYEVLLEIQQRALPPISCKPCWGHSRKRAATVASSQCLTEKPYRESKCKIRNAQKMVTTKLVTKYPHDPPPAQTQAHG